MLAEGRALDAVMAVVRSDAGVLRQLVRLRAITGLGLLDAQRPVFRDSALDHIGLREIGLILSFPALTGEHASVIRNWYSDAVLDGEPWLTVAPASHAPESAMYYWRRDKPGPKEWPGYGSYSTTDRFRTGFTGLRAELRAVPADPPRLAVVADTAKLFTCRFAI
ncbi:hypothetical protein GCM10009560_07680 [Nonomuraea longicatena]|uniref:Uncharacterized protein n=2 Tax=Nonomuraea longicatena TaxID=83682 RepID=A0ABP3Z384_9ACTN